MMDKLFFLLFFTVSLFADRTVIQLPREDGSLIEGYLSAPEGSPNFPVVVFIDGSFDVSVSANHEKLASRFNPQGIGFLSLEKRGISADSIDQNEYLQHDCFEDRLNDYTLLLNALKEGSISGCSGDCLILGASEGGKIAPTLGSLFPEFVKGLVLIASGGGLPFAEEMKYQSKQLIQQMSFVKRLAYKARGGLLPDEYEKSYAKLMASPDSLEMFGPKTCKWWASYLCHNPLPDLLRVDAPICMIHGEEDILVPVQSADLVKNAFDEAGKMNLTYLRYEGLGHALTGREDVYESMLEWVKSVVISKKPSDLKSDEPHSFGL